MSTRDKTPLRQAVRTKMRQTRKEEQLSGLFHLTLSVYTKYLGRTETSEGLPLTKRI